MNENKNGLPRIASFSMVWIPSNYPLNACVYISMHYWMHYNQSLLSTIIRSSPKAMSLLTNPAIHKYEPLGNAVNISIKMNALS